MATQNGNNSQELKAIGYELFIGALSVLSIVNLVLLLLYLLNNPWKANANTILAFV
jgi:hypothetical protein